jgi:ABC-type transport system involved in Fe-S cluster assembly fused permease/ATPase subunit
MGAESGMPHFTATWSCTFAGTRSIQMLYRAVIFTFAPTALELIFVCAVLAKKFSPLVGVVHLWSMQSTYLCTSP